MTCKNEQVGSCLTRRAFLVSSSAAAIASTAAAHGEAQRPRRASTARSASRVIGANDRINVGMIGVGIRGFFHLRRFVRQSEETKDIQVTAVNDVYKRRNERARDTAKLEGKAVHVDYRDLLARSDVDAVLIATPDHLHAQMAIDAMAAGKDVFLQKPMTYSIEEARHVAEATNKYGRVLQVGSQPLSDPRHQKAKELIEGGEIGELLWGQATAARNSVRGEWNDRIDPEGTAETVDWKRWLGPARQRPFSAERYFRWRKYWDYSGGIATDLFYHTLGPFVYAMGAGFPTRVTGSGGIYVQKDRDIPDTYATVIEYPNFYINLSGCMANAAANKYYPRVIYGHKGTLVFADNQVVIMPEHPERRGARAKGTSPEDLTGKVYEVPPVTDMDSLHEADFFACMRSRQLPRLNADLGYKVMVAIKLGVDSYREGRVKFFDSRLQKAVNKGSARPSFEGDGKNYLP